MLLKKDGGSRKRGRGIKAIEGRDRGREGERGNGEGGREDAGREQGREAERVATPTFGHVCAGTIL